MFQGGKSFGIDSKLHAVGTCFMDDECWDAL